MARKKSPAKKAAAKKVLTKEAKPKTAAGKPPSKKAMPEDIIPLKASEEIPGDVTCMCMQKRPNGKFFSFILQQGRWVQSSAIPFPTKELCEDASC